MEEFDRLVALEDRLIGELSDLATVDGHDFGLGQFNIFVLTDAPAASIRKAQQVVTLLDILFHRMSEMASVEKVPQQNVFSSASMRRRFSSLRSTKWQWVEPMLSAD